MERLLTLIAALVAGAVALLLPTVVGYAGWRTQALVLHTEAEINARLTSQLINSHPVLWKVQTTRLEDLLRRRPKDRTPESRTLHDADGALVAEVDDGLPWPVIECREAVHDAGRPVGELSIRRSLRPVLLDAAGAGLLGACVAALIFVVLRVLPLRALRRAEAELQREATHDGLTGLPNRTMFRERLAEAMARADASGRPLALMFIDLDHFKDINDGLGHEVGDRVLREVGQRLVATLAGATGLDPARRRDDGRFVVARLGGDEFTVVVESVGSTDATAALAERLLGAVQRPCVVDGRELVVSGSVGIAMYPLERVDLDTLLRQADMAMYRAKSLGRGTHHFFNDELNRAVQARIDLDRGLRRAVADGEFELHYQPKAAIGGAVTGVEALLRWRRPGEGLVAPDRFIRALEDNQLIVPVGAWVIDQACAQLARWDAAGLPPLTMAVNLSARQFRDAGLLAQIERSLHASGIAPRRLELELTESLLMEDSELSRQTLVGFARVGVRVAIDDFGTGHSSLAYLKRFEVDTLKIDRSFVRDVPHDADSCAIAAAVVALARSLKLSVVCEGVETAQQLDFLRGLGCDAIQGWLLGRPMPADALEAWLRRYVAGDAELVAWRARTAAPAFASASAFACASASAFAAPQSPASSAGTATEAVSIAADSDGDGRLIAAA